MSRRLREACLANLFGISVAFFGYWAIGLAERIEGELSRHRVPGFWLIFCAILFVGLTAIELMPLRRENVVGSALVGALIGYLGGGVSILLLAIKSVGGEVYLRQIKDDLLGTALVYFAVSFLALSWLFGSLAAASAYGFQRLWAGFRGRDQLPPNQTGAN